MNNIIMESGVRSQESGLLCLSAYPSITMRRQR